MSKGGIRFMYIVVSLASVVGFVAAAWLVGGLIWQFVHWHHFWTVVALFGLTGLTIALFIVRLFLYEMLLEHELPEDEDDEYFLRR